MRNYMFLLLLLTLLITGCWDARDVNDIFIPFVAGYDYIEDRQSPFLLSINFPIIGQGKEKSDILLVEGRSWGETRIDRGNKSSRMLTIGDLKVALIGEGHAKRGTKELSDLLFRSPQISSKLNLAVTEGMAKDVLSIQPENYQTVGQNVMDILNNAGRTNFMPLEDLHTYRIDVMTPGHNPVLPVLRIHGNDKLEISGAALFKKFRMIAKVNQEDMRTLTWLRGEEKNGDILFELEDDEGEIKYLTFEGTNSRSVKASMAEGQPNFKIEIKLTGTVIEALTNFQFAGKEENIQLAEKALEEHVKQQCERFVKDLQEKYRVDAILLGKYARAKWPPLVKDQDWDTVFCKSTIKVNVDVTITNTGEVA